MAGDEAKVLRRKPRLLDKSAELGKVPDQPLQVTAPFFQ